MRRLGSINEFGLKNCYIAGGAVLSRATKTPIADWDVYPKSNQAAIDIIMMLMDDNSYIVNISDRAVTFKHSDVVNFEGERAIIQVMFFDDFPTPESIFQKFDFTVCMGAFDCDTEQYTFHEDFWIDVAAKTLRFNHLTAYPLNSLIRTTKYQKKGYNIGKGEMAKISLAVANKGLPTSWEELESQLGGVYGRSLQLQTEGIEYTLDKAYEILGDLDYNSAFSDDTSFNWVKTCHVEDLLSGSPITLYSVGKDVGSRFFKINPDFTITPYTVGPQLESLIDVTILSSPADFEDMTIIGWKYMKHVDGEYVGSIRGTHNNDVTYSEYNVTSYNHSPYLYVYTDRVNQPTVNGTTFYQSMVVVPIKDIISVNDNKIQTKSMYVGAITPCHTSSNSSEHFQMRRINI